MRRREISFKRLKQSINLMFASRFNAFFLKENSKYQPISEDKKITKNSMRFRGLDGFVAAVSPFNFTAIGGNLSYTPALMVSLISLF